MAENTWELTVTAASFLIDLWPATLVVAGLSTSALVWGLRGKHKPSGAAWLWSLTPFVLPPLLIIWGATHGWMGRRDNPWQLWVMYTLLLAHAPLLALLVWRLKEARWLAVATSIFAAWVSFGAGFASGVAITGDGP